MSDSKWDRPKRPRSEKRCPESANGGCNYCCTGEYKRPLRRKDRHDANHDVRSLQREVGRLDALSGPGGQVVAVSGVGGSVVGGEVGGVVGACEVD